MNASENVTFEHSPRPRFRFNKQLWDRFVEIAQPYFYPVERGGTATFLGLLVVVLVLVVAVTFLLTAGLTKAGQVFFPEFFTTLAGQLVQRIDILLNSIALPFALGTLISGGAIFFALRQKLRQRWRQWSLLALLLFLSFVVNGMNVTISYAFRFIDNALNQKEEPLFWQFLFIYAGIIVLAVPIVVLYRYTRLKLGLFWREWLTQLFFNRYFANRAYYELDSNAINTEIDNPDQRITEDIKSFTEVTLTFLLDILDSILTLLAFTAVLYSISHILTLGLVVYAVLGTAFAIVVGQRLIRINYDQLRLEANFRYGMVHVRDNAESIAFYRGERLEQQQVGERFFAAVRNFDLLIIWQSLIELFQYGYNYFTRIVPYAIVAPLYFAGQTDFGTIGQAYLAFYQVLNALSLITNKINSIAAFAASINRLGTFYERLEDPANAASSDGKVHHIKTQIAPHLSIQDLTLLTPNSEQTLIRDLTLDVDPNDRLLVVGASGCGKSSLMRAIAGLWTNGDGVIKRPDVTNILFLPQRPYMLLGTLRDQIVYPNSHATVSDEELEQVLQKVNLAGLAERVGGLHVERDWPTVLSLGEQQRLAFARILLTQPRYAILDEATSALDGPNERSLYDLLKELDIVYVSVGHRASLIEYHDKVLELGAQGSGWRVADTREYEMA
ncbi:MAG: ABC transporter ATP-binding protein/permease [Synechococcales bacterium]|nr:ABC transporter ATP-binding protein/permease [Synechococcales bacterium]